MYWLIRGRIANQGSWQRSSGCLTVMLLTLRRNFAIAAFALVAGFCIAQTINAGRSVWIDRQRSGAKSTAHFRGHRSIEPQGVVSRTGTAAVQIFDSDGSTSRVRLYRNRDVHLDPVEPIRETRCLEANNCPSPVWRCVDPTSGISSWSMAPCRARFSILSGTYLASFQTAALNDGPLCNFGAERATWFPPMCHR